MAAPAICNVRYKPFQLTSTGIILPTAIAAPAPPQSNATKDSEVIIVKESNVFRSPAIRQLKRNHKKHMKRIRKKRSECSQAQRTDFQEHTIGDEIEVLVEKVGRMEAAQNKRFESFKCIPNSFVTFVQF